MRFTRRLSLALTAAMLAPGTPADAAAGWRLEQPPPPAGARFKVALGAPGDLKFWAANRGLLSVEGNSTVARGLLAYDGQSWHPLSTVCGGTGDTSRIAWAGPDEFWTITEPSQPRSGSGLGLCHFKDGVVVGSYSTPEQASDPFRPMNAAACNGPDDCWFGGVAAKDPSGVRQGGFHLHWDGSQLTSVYGPQGRGISDITPFQGGWYETTFVGAQRENRTDPIFLARPEPYGPELVHDLDPDGVWHGANFVAHQQDGVPVDGTELLAADATSSDLWFAGGGAASGPDAPPGGSVARPPIAVHLVGQFLQELPLDAGLFGETDRFVDLAAVPGTTDAWAADQPFADRGSRSAKAIVALIHADGTAQRASLPSSGAGRGSAVRIEFTGPNEGWMVTSAGWLFHYTDGTQLPLDTDPAFAKTISFRPNEAAAQFVPDTPPADDSRLFAPPPVQVVTQGTATPSQPRQLAPLLKNIHKPRLRVGPEGIVLSLSFTVVRAGKVQLRALRRGHLVAKTKLWTVHPGKATLHLLLHRKRWPTSLKFVVKVKGVSPDAGTGGGDDTVTTTSVGSPDAVTTALTGSGGR
jgi:hypothetical protein